MERRLSILIVDDEEIVHQTLGDFLRQIGHTVHDAHDGAVGLEMIQQTDFDLALLDIRMPTLDGLSLLRKIEQKGIDLSCVMITAHGDMEAAITSLRHGAVDFLTKPIKLLDLEAVIEKATRLDGLRREGRHLRATIDGIQGAKERQQGGHDLIGRSHQIARVREQISQVIHAQCDTVLVMGETGTGKEVVARAVHFGAESLESPFIAVSCPAVPDTLIESELFGHVRGSFTGASSDRKGCFELANGGTLFLDEVGDLSALAQAVLLRALETRRFRPVGAKKEIEVNVRVVAATNVDLHEAVDAGEFRSDLYYRLNVFPIELSPLRERPDDVLPLADHFLATYATSKGWPLQRFSDQAREMLCLYDYPGNARELRNIVERSAIVAAGHPQIDAKHLSIRKPRDNCRHVTQTSEHDERGRIMDALNDTRWNRRAAAKKLDMPYSTLRYKIEKLGIGRS